MQGLENQVIENILFAERSLRLALGVAFGLAFFGNALLLVRRDPNDAPAHEPVSWSGLASPSTSDDSSYRFLTFGTRIAFLLGTACAVASTALATVSPHTTVPTLVYLGIALVIAAATLAIDRAPRSVPALSFLSSGFIWLLSMGASYATPVNTLEPARPLASLTALAWLHIGTATVASGLFVAAFLASSLYLVGYAWLKARKLQGRPALPSLEFLDKLVERTSLVGLFLITTSLVSGLGLLFTGATVESVGTVKILWAFAVWILSALSIFGRGFWGWRGRRGALLSVWGTLLIAGSLFGTLFR